MPAAKNLNPSSSPAAFFGAELRRLRTKAGWTQEQLGDQINYSGALVGAVETADRKPQLDFARRCDEVLGSEGLLGRLWEFRVETFPGWFRPWLEVERDATTLRSWEPLVIPGLLQTAEYAREMLRAGRPGVTDEQIDELVDARLERQAILANNNPPLLWFVIDEGVLHRHIGEPKVMHDQLQTLIEKSRHPHVTIQVVPLSTGAHPGLNGAFAIASFNGSPDMVYMDSIGEGHVSDRPEEVAAITNVYDAIRAEALPVRASLDVIMKVMEQWT